MPWKTLHFTPKANAMMMLTQFDAIICAKHNIQPIKQMENYDFVLKDANEKITKKTTDNVIKSNKCNQCDYASSHAGNLRTHLKTHSGEKSNKCNQCDYVSSYASALKKHLKIHSGEKSNK